MESTLHTSCSRQQASPHELERLSRRFTQLRQATLGEAALRVDCQGASQAVAALTIVGDSACEPKPIHFEIRVFPQPLAEKIVRWRLVAIRCLIGVNEPFLHDTSPGSRRLTSREHPSSALCSIPYRSRSLSTEQARKDANRAHERLCCCAALAWLLIREILLRTQHNQSPSLCIRRRWRFLSSRLHRSGSTRWRYQSWLKDGDSAGILPAGVGHPSSSQRVGP